MLDLTRRQALQTGLALSASALAPGWAEALLPPAAETQAPAAAPEALPRRRQKLDLGWRFR
ncbi:MAG: hypothetical protein ACRD1E_08265, partial [Terriglobales bacterium]